MSGTELLHAYNRGWGAGGEGRRETEGLAQVLLLSLEECDGARYREKTAIHQMIKIKLG